MGIVGAKKYLVRAGGIVVDLFKVPFQVLLALRIALALLVTHSPSKLKDSDLQRKRQRIRIHDLCLEFRGKLFDQVGIIAVMHWNCNLGLELPQDFSGEVRRHSAPTTNGREGNVHLT